ncbi:MAG: acyl-CoA dehydrogenase family protein [Actinomycetota bacterium]|nr:acyl-CoA dehydrogenase family protein [Actinomycetota bacterium]MED5553417.1 acyl-CoA dehydrogenase family protein [Actinomycetota bacterium]
MNTIDEEVVSRAIELADGELFPNALDVDVGGQVPAKQLGLIRDAGFHGLFSPTEVGGLGASPETQWAVHEALAGGCLTTSFVWAQHAGPSRAAAETTGPMREEWASLLATGGAQGGVAFAHLNRPGPPILEAHPCDDGWLFSGTAPFVTGWGHIDVVLTAARSGDMIVWAMVDAKDCATLKSRRLSLAAIDSAVTVELSFAEHPVARRCVTSMEQLSDWRERYRRGLRSNGSNPLGVTARATRLLGPSPLDTQLAEAREAINVAPVERLPEARARLGDLCVRATSALVANTGGSALFIEQQAQRLAREALFLLVQGQTPEIKRHHLALLASDGSIPRPDNDD